MKFRLPGVFFCIIALVTAYSLGSNEVSSRNATPGAQNAMNIEENRTRNEAAVRELIDGFVKAIRAKDISVER